MLYRVFLGLLALVVYGSDVATVAAAIQPDATSTAVTAVEVDVPNDGTESPTLLLNGIADDVSVEAGTLVVAESSEGSEINIFEDAHCSDNPIGHWREGNDPIQFNAAVTVYFQARWIHEPTVRSACLQLEWRSDPPALTLNGMSQDISVPVGTVITLSHSENAELGQFSTAGCSGSPEWGEWSTNRSGMEASSDTPRTYYWMTRRVDKPELTSPCLAMTWFREDAGPPVLTLNGGTRPVSVPVGTAIMFDFPAGSTLWEFESAECTGNHSRVLQAIQRLTFDDAGTRSYFAAWNEDSSVRSGCVEATWFDQADLSQPPPADGQPGTPADLDPERNEVDPAGVETPHSSSSQQGLVHTNQVTGLPATGAGNGDTPLPVWAGSGAIVIVALGLFFPFRRIYQP